MNGKENTRKRIQYARKRGHNRYPRGYKLPDLTDPSGYYKEEQKPPKTTEERILEIMKLNPRDFSSPSGKAFLGAVQDCIKEGNLPFQLRDNNSRNER